VLGISITSAKAFLAVVQDATVQDGQIERLDVPPADASGSQLSEALADIKRRLAEIKPDVVAIVGAEPSFTDTESGLRPRLTFEALTRLAAAERRVSLDLVSRARVRSRLGLPRRGGLGEHISAAGPVVGRYWTAGRAVAALAALTVEKEIS
jgi:hypothetical protein